MKVAIGAPAVADLKKGYRFYEKREKGAGRYFIDSLLIEIDSLKWTAGIHARHFVRFHRMLSRRFPFAIYYRLEGETAQVMAVVDLRRQPAWIQKKMDQV